MVELQEVLTVINTIRKLDIIHYIRVQLSCLEIKLF